MKTRQVCLFRTLALFVACAIPLPLLAHGDKVIPQVPDGIGGDGTTYRTKFDITNVGPVERITNTKVLFFQQNGSAWTVPTNSGTVSEIALDLGPFQTVRIETLGTRSLASGYAIVRSLEGTTKYAEDFEVSVTAFYEVLKGGNVIDTISVPVAQPTRAWTFPAQNDSSKNLYTGFAIVNLSNGSNTIKLNLWASTTPSSGSPTQVAKDVAVTLAAREQRATFLNQIVSAASTFKGMVFCQSDAPVATVALLQSPTPTGVQFATMVPSYADAQRRNTLAYLREGLPLDADLPVSDYFETSDDDLPWDVLYQTQTTTTRQLVPWAGASVAVIGQRSTSQFDDEVTLPYLQGLTYSTGAVDMSNTSTNLTETMAFAIKTGLGRYVKMRIAYVVERGTDRDLVLEIYTYK
jgi:hypothetical protein